MSYLNYDGLAYFKSKLTNWVDQNYLSKTNTGNLTVAGHVTFTNPITGDLDGKAKKDWLGQKIDETYIKSIATNDNAGTIVYTKGNGSTNHILIDLLQGATPIANGRAGLVPAPTVSEMNYFLRGDGNWAVPTDVYVNQNLIASSNNNQFPVLLSGTSGTPATKTNATVGYTNVVSVNPLTNALMASQFISKHPTYNRQSTVTSKVQYSLNFTDIVSGAGHNLGEVVGYVDTVANGGEHELGLRLFGNPNVQGTEEDYVYMGVGLSKTNIAYGHAPSTPLPADHNEPTDIITRDWLARNGSETGLVHTSMNETIGGIKTFTDETRNTSSAGITTTKLTASGKITGTGTAEISGGSGNTPSLKVTGNETVTGDLNVGGSETVAGNISTTSGNISTTNGTVSGKTGSIGTGGLTVTGPSNLNGGASVTGGNGLSVTGNETVSGTLTVGGKITGNGGAAISGGNGLQVTGNETVTGKLTAEDLEATDDLTVGDTATVGGQILKKTGTNTTQEYVSYITNQEGTRNTIITNLIKDKGGLAQDSNHKIYVQTGDGLSIDENGNINVDFEDPDPAFIEKIVKSMIDLDGAIVANSQEYLPKNTTYHYLDENGDIVEATTTQRTKNPNWKKLTIDFSKIDEDTKSDILAALDLQTPLVSNLYITVDNDPENTNATDNLTYADDGGITRPYSFKQRKALPFKTIQAAANWVSSRVNLVNKNAYIEIVGSDDPKNPRIYIGSVSLPELATSTGSAVIRTKSGKKDVLLISNEHTTGIHNSILYANSGACHWSIYHLQFGYFISETSGTGQVMTVIGSTTPGASVDIHGCDIYVMPEYVENPSYDPEATEGTPNAEQYASNTDYNSSTDHILFKYQCKTTIAGNQYGVRIINADSGGKLSIYNDSLGSYIYTKLPETNTAGMSISVLNISRGSTCVFRRTEVPSSMLPENATEAQITEATELFSTYYIEGTFSTFMDVWQGGSTNTLGGSGVLVKFTPKTEGAATGCPYKVSTGSYICGPANNTATVNIDGTNYTYTYTFPGTYNTSTTVVDGNTVLQVTHASTVQTTTCCWTSGVHPAPNA